MKLKKAAKRKVKEAKKEKKKSFGYVPSEDQNAFNFGGIPKDIAFNKNMGCGG